MQGQFCLIQQDRSLLAKIIPLDILIRRKVYSNLNFEMKVSSFILDKSQNERDPDVSKKMSQLQSWRKKKRHDYEAKMIIVMFL